MAHVGVITSIPIMSGVAAIFRTNAISGFGLELVGTLRRAIAFRNIIVLIR